MSTRLERDELEEMERREDWAEHRSPGCVFCRRPVEAGRDFRRTLGWTGGPGRDGFIRDGYEDEWAHKHCIEVNKTVGMGQESFDV